MSNGLETFVQERRLTTPEQLGEYMNSYLALLPYNELGVMILAYKNHSIDFITELDNLWGASRAPYEIRNGSEKMCARFFKIWDKIRNVEILDKYKQLVKDKTCYGHHPIAVGIFAAEIGVPIEEVAHIYSYSLLSAITTNAVKSVPLSQLDGQRVLNEAFPLIAKAVEKSIEITVKDIGVSGTEFEIYAMNHETLYSRLYMS